MNTYNVLLEIANVTFDCPYCSIKYNDYDEKYLKRCNKNKSGITYFKCSCGNKVYITFNMIGNIVAFKRKLHIQI